MCRVSNWSEVGNLPCQHSQQFAVNCQSQPTRLNDALCAVYWYGVMVTEWPGKWWRFMRCRCEHTEKEKEIRLDGYYH